MEDSAVSLLSVKTHKVENNNMVALHLFEFTESEKYERDDDEPVIYVKKRPVCAAATFLAFAVLFLIATVGIIIRYTAFQKIEALSDNSSVISNFTSIVPTKSSVFFTSNLPSISITSVVSYLIPSSSVLITSNVCCGETGKQAETASRSLSATSLPFISSSTNLSASSAITDLLYLKSIGTFTSSTSTTTTFLSAVVSSISTESLAISVPSVTFTSTVISSLLTDTSTTETAFVFQFTSIKIPECEGGKYMCIDGTCIKQTDVCNGIPDCARAEDEPVNCSCSASQFQCSSGGQCVAKEYRCDSRPQCNDRSDEINCTNCTGFQCDSGQCLWRKSARCDRVFECLDLSDEKNCAQNGYWRCNNSVLINENNVCNGIDNCFDNSDEVNCGVAIDGCPIQKRKCRDNTCVLHEWWCDGYPDCPDRFDETECGSCGSGQFQCPDYSCISASQVCDGIKHCPSGTDEVNCVMLQLGGETARDNGLLMLKSFDHYRPVCSELWYPALADSICQLLGHKGSSGAPLFVSMARAGVTNLQGFMVFKTGNLSLTPNQTVLSQFAQMSTCSSKKVVQISCQTNVCGKRQVDILTPMIVGGALSQGGKWPWVVSMSMLGEDICGGVILSPDWILTAAHCIVTAAYNYQLTPHFFTITAGSIVRNRIPNNASQRRHVDRIVPHPNSTRLETGVTDWDLALMHLSSRLQYGDYVQPICLPSQNEEFPTKAQCYLAGWGFINPESVSVDRLRETRMHLWENEECVQSMFNVETTVNTNSTLCAGYHSGLISACKGDSGGPLMCKNAWDHWTVVGIMSHGIDGCNGQQGSRPNRFAKVSAVSDWIQSVIQP